MIGWVALSCDSAVAECLVTSLPWKVSIRVGPSLDASSARASVMSNISIRSHAKPCLSSAILYKVIYLAADRCWTLYSELACNVLDSHSARPAAGNAFAASRPVSIELHSAGTGCDSNHAVCLFPEKFSCFDA